MGKFIKCIMCLILSMICVSPIYNTDIIYAEENTDKLFIEFGYDGVNYQQAEILSNDHKTISLTSDNQDGFIYIKLNNIELINSDLSLSDLRAQICVNYSFGSLLYDVEIYDNILKIPANIFSDNVEFSSITIGYEDEFDMKAFYIDIVTSNMTNQPLNKNWYGLYVDDTGNQFVINNTGLKYNKDIGLLNNFYTIDKNGNINENLEAGIVIQSGATGVFASLDMFLLNVRKNENGLVVTKEDTRFPGLNLGNQFSFKSSVEEQPLPIDRINLSCDKIFLKKGTNTKINSQIYPNSTTYNKTLSWNSSNPSVATVNDNGEVTALSVGEVQITAKTINNKSANINFTVYEKETINEDIVLNVGDTNQSNIILDNQFIVGNVKWSVDNQKIATISETGLVEAVGPGKTTVTGIFNGESFTYEIEVIKKQVIDMSTFRMSNTSLSNGETVKVSLSTSKNSDYEYLRIYFDSEDIKSRISCTLYYDIDLDAYEGSFTVEQYKQVGDWHIDYIYAKKPGEIFESDIYYNKNYNENSYYSFKEDLGKTIFTISGTTPDINAPVLIKDSYDIQNECYKDDNIKVEIKATDDKSGINNMTIYFDSPTDENFYVNMKYDEKKDLFYGWIDCSKLEIGTYTFDYIYISDNASNLKRYHEIDLSSNTDSLNFTILDKKNPILMPENCILFSQNTTISDKIINEDIYIGPNAIVTMNNVEINGNIYVLGALNLRSYKSTLGFSIYANRISFGYSTNYAGTVAISGSSSSSGPVQYVSTNNILKSVPVRFSDELKSYDGILSAEGSALEIADMSINNHSILLENNRFKLDSIKVGDNEVLTIDFTTVFKQHLQQSYPITRFITVKGSYNAIPQIECSDITIARGSNFNAKDSVTARDYEDGDITDKISIEKNNVNIDEIGKYEILYKVTDKAGLIHEKTRKVTVVQEKVSKLEIITPPNKMDYFEGEVFDITGLELNVIYDNGKTIKVDHNEIKYEAPNYLSKGQNTIVLKYDNGEISLPIVAKEIKLDKIEIDKNQYRNEYYYGYEIIPEGVVILHYNNGTKDYIDISMCSYDINEIGSVAIITFSYNGKSSSYSVNIVEDYAVSLGIHNAKYNYEYGEEFANDQGEIIVTMASGTILDTSFYDNDVSVTNYNPYIGGDQIVYLNYKGATTSFVVNVDNPSVGYQTHIQGIGWQSEKKDGELSGTSGESKRLEAIKIQLLNVASGNIEYQTHIQGIGWQNWKANGEMSGTSGQSKRLEAIRIRLTGKIAEEYDVYYRVHAQQFGWLDWAKNGESAGTATYGYRLEGIEVKLVRKGEAAPGNTTTPYHTRNISYQTHVQRVGWQENKYDGEMSGTSGRSLRLEGIKIALADPQYSGGIEYQTHVQTYGWQNWKSNGAVSGTSGESKRLEAIRIRLTGKMAEKYDVYYRVHAQQFGWMGWAKNGENAGSAGYSYRLEGIQIRLVPKGASAPGSTDNAYREK